ncbi:MAG TPA: peptide chain release factor N(5)-glutamine methyltransferase [Gemmatimonadales bacterium]|nr:peptide chain release factor N(5)-glutamine methyltransferase [Gemmatimonadales bacterium]
MPEPGRPSSIANALELAAEQLQRAGVLNARREATALWAALAGVRPGDVWLGRDGEPDAPVADKFWAAVERRASGVPFPYVVGHLAFRTLQLRCDPRALIPRPETEGLVGLVLEWAKGEGGIAADVGTGSGCIALALAVEGPFERVIAVERSPEAAALARENVALVRPSVPVEVRDGELLGPLAGARYRAIVSNPPYVTAAEYDALDPAVREHEPRAALVSGADGLATTRALFAGAARLLAPGGLLAVEIDERRGDAVRALAHEHGWARIGIHDDLFGRPRYALAFPKEDA